MQRQQWDVHLRMFSLNYLCKPYDRVDRKYKCVWSRHQLAARDRGPHVYGQVKDSDYCVGVYDGIRIVGASVIPVP